MLGAQQRGPSDGTPFLPVWLYRNLTSADWPLDKFVMGRSGFEAPKVNHGRGSLTDWYVRHRMASIMRMCGVKLLIRGFRGIAVPRLPPLPQGICWSSSP